MPSPLCPAGPYPVSMPATPIEPATAIVLLPANVVPFIAPAPVLSRYGRHYFLPPVLHDNVCPTVYPTSSSLFSLSGHTSDTRYPLAKYLTYHSFSPAQQSFLANITHQVETWTYEEATQSPH